MAKPSERSYRFFDAVGFQLGETQWQGLSPLAALAPRSTPDSLPLRTNPKPRLIFLNRCYWPDSEATGQLLTDLCEGLATEFDVTVVCGQPNSPTTRDFSPQGVETRNGVTIHRLAHTQFAKRVPAGRLMNLITFANAAGRYLGQTKLAAEVVISETDPFLLPTVAAKHAERIHSKFVCYLQDIYPDVAEAVGKVRSGWLTSQIRTRLRRAYLTADQIVVLGDCMRKRLEAAPWSLDANRLVTIPNWADCRAICPVGNDANELRRREGLADRFVVMHSGNMGLTQRLDVLVDATRSADWPDNAVLLLVGDGAARAALHSQVGSNPLGRVRFMPYQPRNELATSLSAADLHVVSMHQRITGCLCPSKLYGILAAGRPVLAIASEETDLCHTVKKHELGWCCKPGDANEIAKTVALAADDEAQRAKAGRNARDIACTHFDRSIVIEQFKELLRLTLTGRTASASTVNCSAAHVV